MKNFRKRSASLIWSGSLLCYVKASGVNALFEVVSLWLEVLGSIQLLLSPQPRPFRVGEVSLAVR